MASIRTPDEEIVAASANVNDDVSDNDGGKFIKLFLLIFILRKWLKTLNLNGRLFCLTILM